ncbi:MAG TPA: MFS transporter [Chthonomonadaceae bacterium]|nr:MFS transporter [Chthonomonadaceae bacterium]
MKRSALLILAFTVFLDFLGLTLIIPLLPVYITHYGGNSWIGGLLTGSFAAMQFLFAPIWGHASDRYGRRPLILMSLIGSAITYFFFGAAGSLTVLFLARIGAGILTAASLPTAQAYVADVTPPEKRAGGMALLGACIGLGFAFGPIVGGKLSQYSLFGGPPIATPAYVAAALALLNFVWAFFMLPETHTDRQPTQEKRTALDTFSTIVCALRAPTVGEQLTVYAFGYFAFMAVEASLTWLVVLRFDPVLTKMAAHAWQSYAHLSFAQLPQEVRKALPAGISWPAYAHLPFTAIAPALVRMLKEKASAQVTSFVMMIVGLTLLVTQGLIMRGLSRRVGEHQMVMFGSLLLTVCLVGLAITSSLTVIYIISAGIAVGNGLMMPALSALITHSAGPQERGVLSGAQQGLASLSRATAPPLNNFLIGLPHGTGIPFFISAILMGVSFVLSLRLRPLPHRADASPPSESEVQPGDSTVSSGEPAADLPSPPVEARRE